VGKDDPVEETRFEDTDVEISVVLELWVERVKDCVVEKVDPVEEVGPVDEEPEFEDTDVGISVVLELWLEEIKNSVVEEAVIDDEVSENSVVLVVALDDEDKELIVTLAVSEETPVELSNELDRVEDNDEESVVKLVTGDNEVVEEPEDSELALEPDDVDKDVGVSVVVKLEEVSEVKLAELDDPVKELVLEESVLDDAELDDSVKELVLNSDVDEGIVDPVIITLEEDSGALLEDDNELKVSEDEPDVELDSTEKEVDTSVIVMAPSEVELDSVGCGVRVETLDEDADAED